MYNSSMKHKWDNENVRDYAREEGKLEGKLEVARDIAGKLKKEGLSIEFIAETTGLTIEEIEKL
jgi:predicted transposase/invertase (TIGR01784 family)